MDIFHCILVCMALWVEQRLNTLDYSVNDIPVDDISAVYLSQTIAMPSNYLRYKEVFRGSLWVHALKRINLWKRNTI